MKRPLRVLVVTPFVPSRNAGHGGGRIVAESLLHLAERHRVALLTLRGPGESGVPAELRSALELVEEIARHPIGRSPRRLVSERARVAAIVRRDPPWVVGAEVADARRRLSRIVEQWQPDVVQLEFLAMGRYATAIRPPRPPLLLVHHDAFPDGAEPQSPTWARHTRESLAEVDAVVVFSERDRRRVLDEGHGTPVHVIAPGLEALPQRSATTAEAGVLFVGGFVHAPNVDAAGRLVRTIHPLVRARRPETILTIVGADPPVGALDAQGVVVTGRVPDVLPYLEAAAVVVAPLRYGGGVRVKVMEALGAGKAVVATACAVEGLSVVDGEHLLVRDEDEQFALAVVELLDDDDRRARLGTAARAWAGTSLSWNVAVDRYDAVYAELLAR